MDWFSVLLLIIFVVLPLVQQFLQKREPPQLPPPEQRDWEWGQPPTSEPGEQGASRRRITKVEDVNSWSEEWGAWPGEAAEQVDDEELFVDLPGAEEPAPEVLPAQHPAPPQVVSMEPLNVDRAAEHQRFHDRYVARPSSAPPPRPTNVHSPIAAMLRERDGVRRAVILSEVLGPPRALQSLEPRE